jgi:hypothetical protein
MWVPGRAETFLDEIGRARPLALCLGPNRKTPPRGFVNRTNNRQRSAATGPARAD